MYDKGVLRPASTILQAFAAIAFAVFGVVSFFTVPAVRFHAAPRYIVVLQFYEGRFRVFWIEAAEAPVSVEFVGGGANMRTSSRVADWPPLPPGVVGADVSRDSDWDRYISVGGCRQVPSFGGAWKSSFGAARFRASPGRVSYVRLPVWLPCLLLLYRPCLAILVGVRERARRRKNLCLACGYHLKGLTEPRCPECGTKTSIQGSE